jgi:hypothetical protein
VDQVQSPEKPKFVRCDACAIVRIDSISKNGGGRMNAVSVDLLEKLDRFPTKLQLRLWAIAGLTTMLAVAASTIAVLLRLYMA